MNETDLSQEIAVFGLSSKSRVSHYLNGGEFYILYEIPTVKSYNIGIRSGEISTVVALIHESGLEEAVYHIQQDPIVHNLPANRPVGGQTLNSFEAIEHLVYMALGYQPPEGTGFTDHPFPSTQDNGLSGR